MPMRRWQCCARRSRWPRYDILAPAAYTVFVLLYSATTLLAPSVYPTRGAHWAPLYSTSGPETHTDSYTPEMMAKTTRRGPIG